MKITPAHDYNDYDVGKRHNLPFVEMINETGLITDVCEQFKVIICMYVSCIHVCPYQQ